VTNNRPAASTQVGGAARSIDARLAEATVPADRDQIFAAIERLDGGFDGLNQARAAWGFLPPALLFIRFIPDTRVTKRCRTSKLNPAAQAMRRAQQLSLAAAAEGVVERTDPWRAALPDAALALEVCRYTENMLVDALPVCP
jgi:hypothetical protein